MLVLQLVLLLSLGIQALALAKHKSIGFGGSRSGRTATVIKQALHQGEGTAERLPIPLTITKRDGSCAAASLPHYSSASRLPRKPHQQPLLWPPVEAHITTSLGTMRFALGSERAAQATALFERLANGGQNRTPPHRFLSRSSFRAVR